MRRFNLLKHISFQIIWPIFSIFPISSIRIFILRLYGAEIGDGTYIGKHVDVKEPKNIRIGSHCYINKYCLLDGRGGLSIGSNVDIAQDAYIWSAQHDYNDDYHSYISAPVQISDYVWICSRSTILPGVAINKGAVVACGAVVSKDVEEMTVVGGVPAKMISIRTSSLKYTLRHRFYY